MGYAVTVLVFEVVAVFIFWINRSHESVYVSFFMLLEWGADLVNVVLVSTHQHVDCGLFIPS